MEKERIFQSQVNYKSADWEAFRSYIKQLREDYRDALENKENDPVMTAFYRGKVSLCKDLLALPRVTETE